MFLEKYSPNYSIFILVGQLLNEIKVQKDFECSVSVILHTPLSFLVCIEACPGKQADKKMILKSGWET